VGLGQHQKDPTPHETHKGTDSLHSIDSRHSYPKESSYGLLQKIKKKLQNSEKFGKRLMQALATALRTTYAAQERMLK
jgi:hypothetical protein